MCRKGRLGAKAVINGHAQPAALGQVVHQGFSLLLFLANHPGPAVYLQQHRITPFPGLMGMINVEQIALAGIRVGDMAVLTHAYALEIKRLYPMAGENVIAQDMLALGGYIRAIILSQRPAQGGAKVLRRIHRLAVQVDQAQPGQREDTQSGLGQRLGQPTRKGQYSGHSHLPQHMNQGQLTAQPGTEEIHRHQPVEPARLYYRRDSAVGAQQCQKEVDTCNRLTVVSPVDK